jgi:hypothetical protein
MAAVRASAAASDPFGALIDFSDRRAFGVPSGASARRWVHDFLRMEGHAP